MTHASTTATIVRRNPVQEFDHDAPAAPDRRVDARGRLGDAGASTARRCNESRNILQTRPWPLPSRPAGWPRFSSSAPCPFLTLAASPTRIDLFDPRGNHTGAAAVTGDRVDFYDDRGNRAGWGRLQDRRRVDFFDARSTRTGSGRIWGGRPQTSDRQGHRTAVSRWPRGGGDESARGRDPSEPMLPGGSPGLSQRSADQRSSPRRRRAVSADPDRVPLQSVERTERNFAPEGYPRYTEVS
jgi:hypothetical protein